MCSKAMRKAFRLASRKFWSLVAFLPFLACGLAFPIAFGGQPAAGDGTPIPVNALQLDAFKKGAGDTFGKLEFLSGVVLATKRGELGAISSIRVLDGGSRFVAVMDTGHWATGVIDRDGEGRITGLSDFRITAMRNPDGTIGGTKESLDAESLAKTEDRLYVGYERDHRIQAYPFPGFEDAVPLATELPVLAPGDRLRGNGGLETLLVAPEDSRLEGALVFVAERSYNKDGNFIAGVQSGPMKGTFYVERIAPYDITDGVFLDDGSFLLLERKFGLADGIGMRIRRFSGNDIAPGETVSGEILMEADFSHQIDNMEGIDAYRAADGSTRLIVTSDDNHSLLQRNLMLEFRLLP